MGLPMIRYGFLVAEWLVFGNKMRIKFFGRVVLALARVVWLERNRRRKNFGVEQKEVSSNHLKIFGI